MSVVPKLNASIWGASISNRRLHRERKVWVRELTESVGGIHGKEKDSETNAVNDRCLAVHAESLADGNIV